MPRRKPPPDAAHLAVKRVRGKIVESVNGKRYKKRGHKPAQRQGNAQNRGGQTPHKFDVEKAVMAGVLAHLNIPQTIIAATLGIGSQETLRRHYGAAMAEGMELPVALARAEMFRKAVTQSLEHGAVRAGIATLEEFDNWNAYKRVPSNGKANGQIPRQIDAEPQPKLIEHMKAAYAESPDEEKPTIRAYIDRLKHKEGGAGD